ncbi:DNA-binding IscR family transcriptional regulator [Nocardioides thalensis]|uniref:DNA-binding IscR family transcriptional regulator n=1 Tax=Nocardioides thalensis TaxID=1914755 RepID=A0A853C7N6_9ACTN|nr:Rrf2 family transcriptional regulator [Nocardioides thalensis]NYJ03317.1 DNA-binding IscR family transcriptional regulator [Nocardioides thalensis]
MSATSRLTNAVHALCWLELAARRGRPRLTSAEIAASLASHPVQVRRDLAPLRRAGLVEVAGKGPGGGWSLTRPADAITLQEVSAALGESGPFALHPHLPNQECPVGAGIAPVLDEVYAAVQSAIDRELGRRTVADVLEQTVAPAASS